MQQKLLRAFLIYPPSHPRGKKLAYFLGKANAQLNTHIFTASPYWSWQGGPKWSCTLGLWSSFWFPEKNEVERTGVSSPLPSAWNVEVLLGAVAAIL